MFVRNPNRIVDDFAFRSGFFRDSSLPVSDEAKNVLERIRKGPPIVRFSHPTHAMWEDLELFRLWGTPDWNRQNDPLLRGPKEIPFERLGENIDYIRQICIIDPANPATRAFGLFTLHHIGKGIHKLIKTRTASIWRDPEDLEDHFRVIRETSGSVCNEFMQFMLDLVEILPPGEVELLRKGLRKGLYEDPLKVTMRAIWKYLHSMEDEDDLSTSHPHNEELLHRLQEAIWGLVDESDDETESDDEDESDDDMDESDDEDESGNGDESDDEDESGDGDDSDDEDSGYDSDDSADFLNN